MIKSAGLFFLLLFIVSFPLFLEALECNIGKECVPFSNYNESSLAQPSIFNKQWARDFCVFFQCIVDGGKVMKGAGRFKDFENVCKDVDSATKEMLKSRNGTYWDNNLVYASCDDASFCNTNALIKEDMDQIDATFGKNVSALDGTIYDETCNMNLTCDFKSSCMQASLFGRGFPWIYTDKKYCNACVYYNCLFGNGFGKLGFGCYEDFLNDCTKLDPKVKEKIEANLPNTEYEDENVIFFSCNQADQCAETRPQIIIVETNHGEKPYPKECSDGIATTTSNGFGTSPTSKGTSNFDFKLYGIMIAFVYNFIVFL